MKLDLGAGRNKKGPEWTGVDRIQFEGVDVVCDLGRERWPWEDGSIEEARASHFIEHLEWPERVHFFNELHRVLAPKAKAEIILPHWCSHRFYGDPTHKAPMSEMAFYYLQKKWRTEQAPHCDSELAPGPLAYSCDFDASWGYSLHPSLHARNEEYRQMAVGFFKEAAQDILATVTKRG